MIISTIQKQMTSAVTDVDNFTVNNAVASVDLVNGTDDVLYANQVDYPCWFTADQGCTVLSAFLQVPYGLNLSGGGIPVAYLYQVEGGATGPVPEMVEGTTGWSLLPLPNVEVPLNVFVAPPPAAIAANARWRFKMILGTGAVLIPSPVIPSGVSMLGVPALLNTAVVPVFLGMKILHAVELELPV